VTNLLLDLRYLGYAHRCGGASELSLDRRSTGPSTIDGGQRRAIAAGAGVDRRSRSKHEPRPISAKGSEEAFRPAARFFTIISRCFTINALALLYAASPLDANTV
jgi:hypothetical protein